MVPNRNSCISRQWRKYRRCNRCSCTGAHMPSGAHEGRRKKNKQLSRIATGPCFCEWNSWGRVGKVTLSGLDACQSWWVASRDLSAVSAADNCGLNRCMSLSPGWESYHTVTYQIIAEAFICFNHLTDQTFIWDQAAIWARRLIPSSQKSRMKMSQTLPASVNSLAFFFNWSCCSRGKDLVNQHSWQTPHLCCHGGVHLFSHCPDHFAGQFLVACPCLLITQPPSTRQPGPVAVLLRQTLKLSLIFFASLSHSWLRRQRNV